MSQANRPYLLVGVIVFIMALISLHFYYKPFPNYYIVFLVCILALLIALLVSITASRNVVCTLAGFEWDLNDFCRGWIITGKTGSGKTTAAINNLICQVSRNVKNWGGLAIDDKGSYWETLQQIFKLINRTDDLILLEIVPSDVDPNWQPKHTFSIFEDKSIPYATYARLICDVVSSMGQKGEQAFFKTQAQIHIEYALKALDEAGLPVTFKSCFNVLSSEQALKDCLALLIKKETAQADDLLRHFEEHFIKQPERQLAAVKATIFNYLKFFNNPDIEKVFCPEQSTFRMQDLDKGKVVCLSVPQKYHEERKYIKALLKLLFYKHALKRFDLTEKQRKQKNLLILWADEAQKIVTASEDGLSDYNVVDELREARATIVAATQSYQSLMPAIGDLKKTQVFVANLANRITFSAADEESAKIAAEALGKRKTKKKTISHQRGGRSISYTEEERYHFEPHEIRRLKKFETIVQHCDKGFRKVRLKPVIYNNLIK
jgi:hypothetical protein